MEFDVVNENIVDEFYCTKADTWCGEENPDCSNCPLIDKKD